MPTQPERIASLETTTSIAKWVLGIFIPLVILWGAFITMNVIAVKQQLADGGNTKLVTELKAPKSPEQLQANLAMVTAQIETARVDGKQPNEKKVKALAGALTEVAKRNPALPEPWRAIATLTSYSTSDIGGTTQLPDCDVTQAPHTIDPSELPFRVPLSSPTTGYVFKNCTLHMDHLPPGKLQTGMAYFQADPNRKMTPWISGYVALIFNCNVILTDAGIVESGILDFKAFSSRFEFQIEKTPSAPAQDLLLASLQAPVPGEFSLHLPRAE
jgi:hypothetical protein